MSSTPSVTEELVRKKSEHNEGIIGTLEELSLHQEDIEKIEHLNEWCKEIEILYLQANLISKIENLNKLKKLKYLNLAINNIEKIENLERCESLEKLDLTLNFIGDLESICSLQNNINLKHLYLTGNPCCDFENYREYVITKLPQISTLDSLAISKSERIKSVQNFENVEKSVEKAQRNYRVFRKDQLERLEDNFEKNAHLTDEEFWKTSSENCPETRVEIAHRARKARNLDKTADEQQTNRKQVNCFAKDGRPLNMNQARLDFSFSDEDPEMYVLDIAVYRHLDTNLIDIDLQPIYVRITIKGKIFQIVFPEEIQIDRSTAERSQTTGHLVLRMPLVNFKRSVVAKNRNSVEKMQNEKDVDREKNINCEDKSPTTFLEVPDNDRRCNLENLPWNDEVPALECG